MKLESGGEMRRGEGKAHPMENDNELQKMTAIVRREDALG